MKPFDRLRVSSRAKSSPSTKAQNSTMSKVEGSRDEKKRILIVYATAGTGHMKASLAVKKALDEIAPQDIEVSIIDSLDYTNAFFKWVYLKAYLVTVNNLPLVWGILYYLTDNRYVNMVVARIRRFVNWLNSCRLRSYLMESMPDVIICTHFFASEVISDLKRKNLLSSHLITAVTDYRLHSWWVSDRVETYVVGSVAAKDDLLKCGIDESKIKILGIPVEPIFSKELERDKILANLNLSRGVFTILVVGGGFGVGPIEEIIKAVDDISTDVQVIAICGHNDRLVKRLEGLKKILKVDIKVLGFANNVYDYMEASDILISKSGGITVTESLAKELPMIVISPILGQETRNADFLMKEGIAIKVDRLAELRRLLEDLMLHPEKVERMKEAIRKVKKPAACYDIANLAIELAHSP